MFGNLQLDQQMLVKNMAPTEAARNRNAQLFWKLFMAAQWEAMWQKLAGRQRRLLDLNEQAGMNGRHYLGIQSIPLNQIVGSEGRENDFDAEFRPRQTHNMDRWIGVATARQMGKPLPPVDLIQIGDRYFVRDGHHRISVAHARGEMEIDATVTRWQAN
ncbi:MAG: hypothetical protein H6659_12480 [Ardenticatenaceae bacterium]|nr:hypothetical protein [Ardenticatenaceae bacterium]